MYLGRPLRNQNGVTLLSTHVELTDDYIGAIKERGYGTVYAADDELGIDLPPHDILAPQLSDASTQSALRSRRIAAATC